MEGGYSVSPLMAGHGGLLLVILDEISFIWLLDTFSPRRTPCNMAPALLLITTYNMVVGSMTTTFWGPQLIFLLAGMMAFSIATHHCPWYVSTFVVFLNLVLGYCLDIILLLLLEFGPYIPKDSALVQMRTAVLSKLICMGIAFWLRQADQDHALRQNRSPYAWLLTACLPALTFFFTAYFFKLSRHHSFLDEPVCLLSIGLLVLSFIQISVVSRLNRWSQMEQDNQLLIQQLNLSLRHTQDLEQSNTCQRQLSHDFKNHLRILYALAVQEQNNSVSSYIQSLDSCVTSSMLVAHTGNSMVDAVLNQKYTTAHQQGIVMDLSLSNLEHIQVEQTNLSVVLCNLLDNAIEACQRLELAHPRIQVRIEYQCGELLICVRNPAPDPPASFQNHRLPSTAKPNSAAHGYGLRNVQMILNRCHADHALHWGNGEFIFTAVFYDSASS